MLLVPEPSLGTEVLLIHAPYPGTLRFEAAPTSLLHAIAPLAHAMAARGALSRLGLLDPGNSSAQFFDELRALLRGGRVRVVAISTSTAAIEETARIVATVRGELGDAALILVGGPHEDDCEEKVAHRIPGVDLSIGGDAEFALRHIIECFLEAGISPEAFVRELPQSLTRPAIAAGRFVVSSPWWGVRGSKTFDFGALEADLLGLRPHAVRGVRFSVFKASETLPLLVSRGCSYGRCTFCAEGGEGRQQVATSFAHIASILRERPGTALYFQDSIFPRTPAIRSGLLPLLRENRVDWGAQVFLRTLTRGWVEELAQAGCTYLYTGLESGSTEILEAVGKGGLSTSLVLERLAWLRDVGIRVGVSLMFGAMDMRGELRETKETLEATMRLVGSIRESGIFVTGFYPNVQTVLPGTSLARGLAESGIELDFYRLPRRTVFEPLEDGAVGHTFLTLGEESRAKCDLAESIMEAARVVSVGP
jgi:anaerobic magnesium-protoporphyrin IX monomethyl ester cyclase